MDESQYQKHVYHPPVFAANEYPFGENESAVIPRESTRLVFNICCTLLGGNHQNLRHWSREPNVYGMAEKISRLFYFMHYVMHLSSESEVVTENKPTLMVLEALNEYIGSQPSVVIVAWRLHYFVDPSVLDNLKRPIFEFFVATGKHVRDIAQNPKHMAQYPKEIHDYTFDRYMESVAAYLTLANTPITEEQRRTWKSKEMSEIMFAPTSPYALHRVFTLENAIQQVRVAQKNVNTLQQTTERYTQVAMLSDGIGNTHLLRPIFPVPQSTWLYNRNHIAYPAFFGMILPVRMDMLNEEDREAINALREAFPGLNPQTLISSGVSRMLSQSQIRTLTAEKNGGGNVLLTFFTPYTGLRDELEADFIRSCELKPSDAEYYAFRRRWQLSALNRFRSIWDCNREDISLVNHRMIDYESRNISGKADICVPLKKVSMSLSRACDMIARFMLALENILGVVYVHGPTLHSYIAFLQPAWNKPVLHCHPLLVGDPAKGKSHAFSTAAKMLIPDAVLFLTNMTEKSLTGAQYDLMDRALAMNEASPAMLGIGDGKGVGVLEQMVKDMLTGCKISYQETAFRTDAKGNRGDRITITRDIEATCCVAMCLNTAIADVQSATMSRMDTFSVTSDERTDGVKIMDRMRVSDDRELSKLRKEFIQQRHILHYLYFKLEKMIHSSIISDVDMTIPQVYFMIALENWAAKGIHTNDTRQVERMCGKARTLTILYALESVFFNPSHPVYGRPISDELFLYVEEYLVCTEDIAWMVIGLCKESFIPKPYMQIIEVLKAIQKDPRFIGPAITDDEQIDHDYRQFEGDIPQFAAYVHAYHSTTAAAIDDYIRILIWLKGINIRGQNSNILAARIYLKGRERRPRLQIACPIFELNFDNIVEEAIRATWHAHTRTKIYEHTSMQRDRYIITGEQEKGVPHIMKMLKVETGENLLVIRDAGMVRHLTRHSAVYDMEQTTEDGRKMRNDAVRSFFDNMPSVRENQFLVRRDFEELVVQRHLESLGIDLTKNKAGYSAFPSMSETIYAKFLESFSREEREQFLPRQLYPTAYITPQKTAQYSMANNQTQSDLLPSALNQKQNDDIETSRSRRMAAFQNATSTVAITFGTSGITTMEGPNVNSVLAAPVEQRFDRVTRRMLQQRVFPTVHVEAPPIPTDPSLEIPFNKTFVPRHKQAAATA